MKNKTDRRDIFKALQAFKEEAEKRGLRVYSVMLKGSQNYNLDDEESDIDANLIFIPTLAQIRTNQSYKIINSYGECTCHNIYSFASILAKGNPQWVEVVHTKYKIGNDLDLFKNYKLNPSALKGMLMEKVTAFSKLYPSREKYIKEFGYDPKQLHHIIRLYDCLNNDTAIYEYNNTDRERMVDIKRGSFPGSLKEAEKLKDEYVNKLNELYYIKKLEYKPQEIDYVILDKIVMENLK